jgi:chemotaxis protein MotA
MGKLAEEERQFWHVLRVTMIAFMKGTSPLLATEMGRRAIPGHVRPTFAEFESNCKKSPAQAAAAAETGSVVPPAEAAAPSS